MSGCVYSVSLWTSLAQSRVLIFPVFISLNMTPYFHLYFSYIFGQRWHPFTPFSLHFFCLHLPSRPRAPATAPDVSVQPPAAGCSASSSLFYSAAARPPSPSSCTAEQKEWHIPKNRFMSFNFLFFSLNLVSYVILRWWVCTSCVWTHFSMASSLSRSACCRIALSSAPFPGLNFWINKTGRQVMLRHNSC